MPEGQDGTFTIAHISDIHCGGPDFVPNLMERAIIEINELKPNLVICSGDLTTFGFKHEYAMAREYMNQINCDSVVVIPGNHDSRNVGYVHFEDMFGERNSVLRRGGVTVVAVDSTEPDLDHGQIGRGRYRWIEEQFAGDADLTIFVLHHHLLPVPGTGRERTVVSDAGDGEDMRALAICDGEHYAPVVRDALAALPYEVVALWPAGGGEKLRGGEDYGVPVVDSLEGAIAELEPEIVIDLSDEPVLGPRK